MGQAAELEPVRRRSWRRITLIVAVVAATLIASAAIAYRILAPTDVVTGATTDYPPTPAEASPGVIGTLAAAPLIVDGRLRVYATKRQIRADAPVNARTQRSPFWSYRRWPAQLTGVVAVGTIVVGRWSDGRLVAIDARTGLVAWQADGPVPEIDEYAGRRTGAVTVYSPSGLLTAGTILIARGGDLAVAVDAGSGRQLWSTTIAPPGCPTAEFTTVARQYAVVEGCHGVSIAFYDATSGQLATRWQPADLPGAAADVANAAPLGCRVGRSECVGLRVTTAAGQTAGWLLRTAGPTPAAGLDSPDGWLVSAPERGDLAVTPTDGGRGRQPVNPGIGQPGIGQPGIGQPGIGQPGIGQPGIGQPQGAESWTARRADTGAPQWTWSPGGTGQPQSRQARVIATQPGRVHLLTGDYWLVTLDAGTGVELSRFLFTYGRERIGYRTGYAYAANKFLLLERLSPEGDPAKADDEYYYLAQPVLVAAT